MPDPEEAIERVLDGLRHSVADPEMKARVLRQVRLRAEARSARERHGWPAFHAAPWRVGHTAGLCAIVLLALLSAVSSRHAGPHLFSPGLQTRPATAFGGVPQHAPARNLQNTLPTVPSPPLATRLVRARTGSDRRQDFPMSRRDGGPPVSHKSLAEKEAEAPSLVAPPLPLTNSERLMIQMAQQRRPEEFALLAGRLSAEHEAQDRRDFENFFKPAHPPASN